LPAIGKVVEKILVKREDPIPPFFPVEKQWKTVEKLNICVERLGNLWGKTEAKNKNCKQLYRGLGNRNTGNCEKSQEDFPDHSVPVSWRPFNVSASTYLYFKLQKERQC
jgi:hypothetical protein